jgi:hypothetical protein
MELAMKVMCVNSGGPALLTADIASGNTRSSVFHVTVGRDYFVYGVLFNDAVLKYLVEDDTGRPTWEPASLFEVICGRVSRSWIFPNWANAGRYVAAMSFPEFVEDPESFDRLSVGDKAARAAFTVRKQTADLEFPDPLVRETAKSLQDDWLQCPFCSDAWQSTTLDPIVRCPACQKVSRNPKNLGGKGE